MIWQLRRAATNEIVVERLEVADWFWPRLKGLQFRRQLPHGTGFLLIPCSSIHTCWMRFAIDVVMLDDAGRVVDVRREVRPWRFVIPKQKTHAILELPTGSASFEAGEQLHIISLDGSSVTRQSLQFLTPKPASDRG